MLLSYFRKIDAYSGIRVFAAAVVAFAVLWSAGIGSWQEVVLSFGLGALWLWLSWTLLRDRWVIKASALRFMTFLVLATPFFLGRCHDGRITYYCIRGRIPRFR